MTLVSEPTERSVDVADWFGLYQLYTDYADRLDRPDLAGWLELFEPDCLYRVVSRENDQAGLPLALMRCEGLPGLRDRVHAIENVSVYAPRTLRHVVSGIRASHTETPGCYRVRASFLVAQSLETEHSTLYACGEYRDLVRDTGAGLRFAEKTAVYDGSLIVNSMVYPL